MVRMTTTLNTHSLLNNNPSLSPSLLFSSTSLRHHSPPLFSTGLPRLVMAQQRVRIAVVGDVHDDWDLEEDGRALRFLQVDVVLFTGDFGDENVDLVKSISNLDIPKAAILGNHDAWFTSQSSERSEPVELQLQYLKEQHVGYSRLDFPLLGFTVVGGRPLSCGGDRICQRGIIRARYGVRDMKKSAQKIYEAALGSPEGHSVIILAHNGPSGLGSKIDDICGKDWVLEGGDFGDIDLTQALSNLKRDTEIPIPLVVFGHMHKELAHGNGSRKMIVIDSDGTIYLNAAVVPRVRAYENSARSSERNSFDAGSLEHETGTLRAFTIVEMEDNVIQRISETWVAVTNSESIIAGETVLYEKTHSETHPHDDQAT